ncbi:hypothetical protein [Roseobacter phage RDJL6]|nr:hypothetical protein [Roseobacter phage RDJL6]
MFYAMILVCSTSAPFCTGLEDQRGPYETMEACQTRLEEMDAQVPTLFIPYLISQGIRGPFSGRHFCDTINGLRDQFPTAFESVQVPEGEPV